MTDRHANEWADTGTRQLPRPLLPEVATPNQYPVEALPPLMRDAALAIAAHVMAPLALAGQSIIGAVTHLAQTRANAPHMHKPNGMPCSLMMLTLGLSGDRKTGCRNLAFKEVDEAEKTARNQHKTAIDEIMKQADALKGKARDEFLKDHSLPADPGTQYTDATFERIAGDFIRGKSYATWDTDEAGQMLAGASLKADTKTATIGGLCKAFDDGKFERTRSASNAEGSGIAFDRRLSVHLMGQPVAVAQALADPLLRGQGFLPRFLFAAPASLAGSRLLTLESLNSKSYKDVRLQRYWARCREMMETPEQLNDQGEVVPPVLELDEGAQRAWLNFYNETEAGQGPLGRYAGLQPFAGRAGEQARRVATVLACFEGIDHIDGDCMRRACELVRYSLSEWLRYTDAEAINPDLQNAARAMDWLRDPRRAASWQAFNVNAWSKSGPPALRPAKKRDKVLAVLVEHGHLLTCDGKQFRINPLAETAEVAETQQTRGFSPADDLRKSAESVRIAPGTNPASAALPQTSAALPQAETQQARGLPQNPQNPQPSTSASAGANFEEF